MNNIIIRSIIITCNNIIEKNVIKSNEVYAIYIEGSIHNLIQYNTFLNNSKSKVLPDFSNPDAFFVKSNWNEWYCNYWSQSIYNPKPIFYADYRI